MTITFYDCSTAPSPRRARIILAEKNVPHEVVNIDIGKGEQMGDAYRAINPSCTVPALKLDDGTILTDNAGIAAYLEATYPEPPLFGRTAKEKAEIASWNSRLEMEGLMPMANALRNANLHMKDRALPGPHNFGQIPELAARGMQRLDIFYDMLEAHLEGRDYIATDRFSVCDITAIVMIDFCKVVRKQPGEHHTNIAAWRARVNERKSV